jgi:hypothetical protein
LTTTWRLLDERIDAAHLSGVKTARAAARTAAWAAGAAPKADATLVMDVDASISLDYSDRKENAAATWKHTFGFHRLLVFADRTEIASGEASGCRQSSSCGEQEVDGSAGAAAVVS